LARECYPLGTTEKECPSPLLGRCSLITFFPTPPFSLFFPRVNRSPRLQRFIAHTQPNPPGYLRDFSPLSLFCINFETFQVRALSNGMSQSVSTAASQCHPFFFPWTFCNFSRLRGPVNQLFPFPSDVRDRVSYLQ